MQKLIHMQECQEEQIDACRIFPYFYKWHIDDKKYHRFSL